jgi:hypothetical protein
MTLGLTLLCISQGRVFDAMAPRTGDRQLDAAAQLYDLVVLCLARSALVLLPVCCGAPWLTRPCGLGLYALLNAAATAWLALKATLGLQRAAGGELAVAGTGVVLHVATLVAAQAWGALVGWLELLLVACSREALGQPQRQPPLRPAPLPYYAPAPAEQTSLYSGRESVEGWLSGAAQPGAGGGGACPELQAPLLQRHGAAGEQARAAAGPDAGSRRSGQARAQQAQAQGYAGPEGGRLWLQLDQRQAPEQGRQGMQWGGPSSGGLGTPSHAPPPAAPPPAPAPLLLPELLPAEAAGGAAGGAAAGGAAPAPSPGNESFGTGRGSPALSFTSAGSYASAKSGATWGPGPGGAAGVAAP